MRSSNDRPLTEAELQGANLNQPINRTAHIGPEHTLTGEIRRSLPAIGGTIGFGLLALSKVPVLHDIGLTVGIGAILALAFAAILSRRDEARR